ncbi:MAG: ankyrin repeat domain-containing protein [Planctomycetota bacterium]
MIHCTRPVTLVVLFLICPPAWGQGEADQDQLDSDLKFAVINEDKLKVRDLLRQGADANMTERNGRTPLRSAVFKGNFGIVRLLVEAGADPNASHPSQTTSILVEACRRRGSVHATDRIITYLLDNGAKPDATALATASSVGNTNAVELLLDAGVSPDAGLTAASRAGHVGIIDRLLKAGADANGESDGPPLAAAASGGSDAAVATLLKAKANPNKGDGRGNTPLHHALHGMPNLSVVQRLVESGARMDLANEVGVTPIREAAIRGVVHVYDWLMEQCDGEEPPPSNIEDDESVETEQLLDQLRDKDRQKRKAAQRLLIGRGDSILPAALEQFEANGMKSALWELLPAMGPQANEAIPFLASLLDDKEQVFGALLTLNRMDPRNLERLAAAARKRAAESLVKAIHQHIGDVYGPALMAMLVSLGEDAAPQIVLFLEGDHAGLRAGAARKLAYAPFKSQRIEAQLIDLLLHDPIVGVRIEAARGLRNPHFHSDEARRALLIAFDTRPLEIDQDLVLHGPEEERTKNHLERQAVENLLRETSWTLATYGPSLIPGLRDRFAQADEKTQVNYEKLFDRLGEDPATFASFAKLLDDPHDAVRNSAHQQVAHLAADHSVEAGDLLLRRYAEGDPNTRQEAAWAIVCINGGRKAARYLPYQLAIAGDARLARKTRMHAMRSALLIDAEAAKRSEAAAECLAILCDEIENGEYSSRISALMLVEDLGSAATPAAGLLESLAAKAPGERQTHADRMIRQHALQAIKAIKADSME